MALSSGLRDDVSSDAVTSEDAGPSYTRTTVPARELNFDAVAQSGPSVLYFPLTLALVHMRETRRGRGDSRIRQRRLSSACTQCLRPLLVLLSAAATHSSDVHPTWENRYVAAMISCRTERGLQL